MNRDETVALFLQGKDAWNAWAEKMLAERKAMEADGRWAEDKEIGGNILLGNDQTYAWKSGAAADFSRCLFLAQGVNETKAAAIVAESKAGSGDAGAPAKLVKANSEVINFDGFKFPYFASFESTTFFGYTYFESAVFSGFAQFSGAAFYGCASFIGSAFSRDAGFERASFSGDAKFGSAAFSGSANFKSVTFCGEAKFEGAVFTGDVNFGNAAFTRFANFGGAAFTDFACFESASFSGSAYYGEAAFSRRANFESAAFTSDANFEGATFSGDADFGNAAFTGDAYFESATFSESASFESTAFTGDANFTGAAFSRYAFFGGQTFTNNVFFNEARFEPGSMAYFGLATFERVVQFDDAVFEGEADFNAVWGKRTFSLARARFKGVPDFIQAHFEEAPRLDNVVVEGRLLEPREEAKEGEKPSRRKRLHREFKARSALYRGAHYLYRRASGGIAKGSGMRDMPARWRALKRLAIEGHDTERELQFFSGEMRSQRFTEHWPIPSPTWGPAQWYRVLGFWAGLLYQIFSNFGRSVVRPFIAWAICIVIFAVYFLGQNSEMTMRRDHHYPGWLPAMSEYTRTAWKALRSPPYCYPGTPPKLDEPRAPDKRPDDIQTGLSGLVEEVRAETNLVNEALSIAYHNAVIILDSSGDSAHRAFGCLYGVERYGGNPVAYVPRNVAIASGVQKLLSAIFIFLFGLAVRNMLKMK
jgi:Pentapeptide repeats (9 copies)